MTKKHGVKAVQVDCSLPCLLNKGRDEADGSCSIFLNGSGDE